VSLDSAIAITDSAAVIADGDAHGVSAVTIDSAVASDDSNVFAADADGAAAAVDDDDAAVDDDDDAAGSAVMNAWRVEPAIATMLENAFDIAVS
jgi:hypothetical protein